MKNQLFLLALAFLMLYLSTSLYGNAESGIKVRYEERKPFKIMGLDIMSSSDSENYAQLFTDFVARMSEIENRVSDDIYGLSFPGKDFDAKTMEGSNYLVGMAVSDATQIPKGMILRETPGGNFAIFEHKGLAQTLGETYGYIFGKWIFSSGMKPTGYEMFEVYGKDYAPDNPDSIIEIWVPVFKYK
ncbi:MAG: GyrI-like domain-containing protein [Candidatus Cloacimonetes bacterium]|nr:GyrI-like domain-containing protein [Candidatus Cloacimonadota bacterium]